MLIFRRFLTSFRISCYLMEDGKEAAMRKEITRINKEVYCASPLLPLIFSIPMSFLISPPDGGEMRNLQLLNEY